MMRRFVGAAVVVMVLGGFVLAETAVGLITSVSDKEVKIVAKKKGEKKGEEKTLKVSGSTKFVKKSKDGEEEIKVDAIKEAIEKSKGKIKGVFGFVEYDGDNATKVGISGGKKKKKKTS